MFICSSKMNLNLFRRQTLQKVSNLLSTSSTSVFSPVFTTRRWMSSSSHPALTTFSEEETMLRDMVKTFAATEMQPLVRKMDESGNLDLDLLKKLFDQGLMGIETPPEYSGTGMSFTSSCIVIEELAKVDPAISVIVDIQNTLINTIFRVHASKMLKEKYLPQLATKSLASFCLSEAGSGSDAFALTTSATKDGNNYVLNGTKMWISNAKEADVFLVFATVDKSKGYKGITCFVVDKSNPGLTVGKKEDKMGIRASSTCEVLFNDCVVPEDHVLGPVGQGYKIAIGSLNEGRIGIGAQMLGLGFGAYESAMPYLHQRKQFGTLIGHFQGMQFQTAQARMELEAARLMVYNAARLKDAGLPFTSEAAMCKLYAAQVAERVASKSVEWLGGVGFTKEFPVEKLYRDAKIGAIYEGTTNLMLQTIAKLESKLYE